jgi:glycosyltransferase involved in cell wall biosynthesis
LFCTTIIPTIGRQTLDRAVHSVLAQDFNPDEFEIIVVNDSGRLLSRRGWQESDRVRVVNTNRRERSVARNAGAALAKGRYLHFLDDDDWLADGALQQMHELSRISTASWLYGTTELVEPDGQAIIRLNHGLEGNCFIQVLSGEWIPLQASFIENSTFFAVGGFNPHISGPEDIDLLRRIALVADLACCQALVAHVVRNDPATTTNYARHSERSRQAREAILNSQAAFTRMRAAANTPYWRGRIVRAYLTSAVWNAQRRRGFSASSRIAHGIAAVALAGSSILSVDFWRALGRSYASDTFARGLRAAGLAS